MPYLEADSVCFARLAILAMHDSTPYTMYSTSSPALTPASKPNQLVVAGRAPRLRASEVYSHPMDFIVVTYLLCIAHMWWPGTPEAH